MINISSFIFFILLYMSSFILHMFISAEGFQRLLQYSAFAARD